MTVLLGLIYLRCAHDRPISSYRLIRIFLFYLIAHIGSFAYFLIWWLSSHQTDTHFRTGILLFFLVFFSIQFSISFCVSLVVCFFFSSFTFTFTAFNVILPIFTKVWYCYSITAISKWFRLLGEVWLNWRFTIGISWVFNKNAWKFQSTWLDWKKENEECLLWLWSNLCSSFCVSKRMTFWLKIIMQKEIHFSFGFFFCHFANSIFIANILDEFIYIVLNENVVIF